MHVNSHAAINAFKYILIQRHLFLYIVGVVRLLPA